jgi:hypothetical protein
VLALKRGSYLQKWGDGRGKEKSGTNEQQEVQIGMEIISGLRQRGEGKRADERKTLMQMGAPRRGCT